MTFWWNFLVIADSFEQVFELMIEEVPKIRECLIFVYNWILGPVILVWQITVVIIPYNSTKPVIFKVITPERQVHKDLLILPTM